MSTSPASRPRKSAQGKPGKRPASLPPRKSASKLRPAAGGSRPAPVKGSGTSVFRRKMERWSHRPLLLLTTMPRWVLPAVLAVLLLLGLFLPPVPGALVLAIVLLVVAWLVYMSWPALTEGARVMRLAVVALLAGAVILRFVV